MITAALEYTTRGKRRPSEILPGLYLGGLDAVLNSKFLKSANVAGICTAAGGLDMFGPKWTRGRRKAREELGIEFLDLARLSQRSHRGFLAGIVDGRKVDMMQVVSGYVSGRTAEQFFAATVAERRREIFH